MRFMFSSPRIDRDAAAAAALRQTRILANRSPHFTRATRREANRALDALEAQLGRNQPDVTATGRALELLNRAHPSLLFQLLRDPAVADRYGAALRALGLRGIQQRLDEVPHSVMAAPIPGPIGGRKHRDELPDEERLDASGRPLPPRSGY
jgi:hypothetical protein